MKKFWAAAILAVLFTGCGDSDSSKDKDKTCEEQGKVTCNSVCYDKCDNNAVRDPNDNCSCKAASASCEEQGKVTCNNTCYDKCADGAARDASNNCACPGQSSCTNSCVEGAAPDANDNCTCKCTDTNKEIVNNACVDKCGSDMTRGDDGNCKCTDTEKVVCKNACYDKCADGAARDENCACPGQQTCTNSCGEGAEPDANDSCNCKCSDDNKEYVDNACVDKCDADKERDDESHKCVCKDNKYDCGGTCIEQPAKACDPSKSYTCEQFDINTHWVNKNNNALCDASTCNLTAGEDCVVDTVTHCDRNLDPAWQCDYDAANPATTACAAAKSKAGVNATIWEGTATCTNLCTWDESECTLCGNGDVDDDATLGVHEECDFGKANGTLNADEQKEMDCKAYDPKYQAGKNVICAKGCGSVDTSACDLEPVCGDGEVNGDEVCDGGTGNDTEPKDWKDCTELSSTLYSGGKSTCAAGCGEVLKDSCEEIPEITECYFAADPIALSDTTTSADAELLFNHRSDATISKVELGIVDSAGQINGWHDVSYNCDANNDCTGSGTVDKSYFGTVTSGNYIFRVSTSDTVFYCLNDAYNGELISFPSSTGIETIAPALLAVKDYFGTVTISGGSVEPSNVLAEWHWNNIPEANLGKCSDDVKAMPGYCSAKDADYSKTCNENSKGILTFGKNGTAIYTATCNQNNYAYGRAADGTSASYNNEGGNRSLSGVQWEKNRSDNGLSVLLSNIDTSNVSNISLSFNVFRKVLGSPNTLEISIKDGLAENSTLGNTKTVSLNANSYNDKWESHSVDFNVSSLDKVIIQIHPYGGAGSKELRFDDIVITKVE